MYKFTLCSCLYRLLFIHHMLRAVPPLQAESHSLQIHSCMGLLGADGAMSRRSWHLEHAFYRDVFGVAETLERRGGGGAVQPRALPSLPGADPELRRIGNVYLQPGPGVHNDAHGNRGGLRSRREEPHNQAGAADGCKPYALHRRHKRTPLPLARGGHHRLRRRDHALHRICRHRVRRAHQMEYRHHRGLDCHRLRDRHDWFLDPFQIAAHLPE
mmetsp:Transcript_29318/g.63168  ORF Transcript_29318/g.63168 Transcript_29318/m.63168 type:complete len:214 (-) Transcript_29318:1116-1757(-)